MINLKTGETKPFSPENMCTTSIPITYDRNAKYPEIDKFLKGIMSTEDIEYFLDFMAYCLWREYKFASWMLFNGEGNNGKSTLIRLIKTFLGTQNVSAESLTRILERPNSTANLYGKLANTDADLSGKSIKDTGTIKKLTGNDEIMGERKYQDAFKFTNYAKLIFSCNTIPIAEDHSDAWYRRIIPINFRQQFYGGKDGNEDVNILDKLTTQEELSGLLNELLRRLPIVLKNGIRATTNETLKNTYDIVTMSSNPVKYFCDHCLQVEDGSKIPIDQMYESYKWFSEYHSLTPKSEQSFSRIMTKLGWRKDQDFVKKPNGAEERPYVWIGVKIADFDKPKNREQRTLEQTAMSEAKKKKMT